MENDKSDKSFWLVVNSIIGVVGLLTSCLWGIWLLSIIGIVLYLIIPLVILFILIPIFYKKYRKNGKFHISLLVSRIAFVVLLLIPLPLPYIGVHYEYDKRFYIPKKLIYTYGVYEPGSDIATMLPEHLPDDCRDYKFKTQLGSIAQDYHPSAYLMFYTNGETIVEYEEKFKSLHNCVKSDVISDIPHLDKDNSVVVYSYPEKFPDHAFSWLDDVHKQDLLNVENAVVYRMTDTQYGRGCLLDFDSGLVVFWT